MIKNDEQQLDTEEEVAAPAPEEVVENAPAEADAAQTEPAAEAEDTPQGMNTVDIKKRKRKNIWGFVFTTVIFAFVVWALWKLGRELQGGDAATLKELLASMNGWYLLAAAGLLLVIWACDVGKYVILDRSFGCNMGVARNIKLALTGKYYECITPTGTGGQPMQIYYMYKCGVSGGKSTSVVMVKYAMQMLAGAIVAAVVMGAFGHTLFKVIDDATTAQGLYIAGWVGFGINAFAPVFTVFVIFCPKFLKWLINLGLVLLHKMHILKKLDERRAKIFKGIDDFAVCSQFIFKHPGRFFAILGLCIVEPLLSMVIPYFILVSLCGAQLTEVSGLIFTVAALSTFSNYGSAFIPTPGASGAVETLFMLAFATLSQNAVFWVTLVWRFYCYYILIVLGVGMNIIDLTRKIISARREKKAAHLAENAEE